MRRTGILSTWHDDRGFGFIAPSDGGREVFVHISAFPRDGFRPTVGESLSFEVGPGKDGKPQALRIERRQPRSYSHSSGITVKPKSSRTVITLAVLAVIALGIFGYYKYEEGTSQTPAPQPAPAVTRPEPPAPSNTRRERRSASSVVNTRPEPEASAPEVDPAPEIQLSPQYRCDGRTRCSQMRSCEEAKFFLLNCPGTQMDGDNDGIPCEGQWCGP